MDINKNMFERNGSLMGEKSLSSDSFDTRKISTDQDDESSKSSSMDKSDISEYSLPSSKRSLEEMEELQVKHAKLS